MRFPDAPPPPDPGAPLVNEPLIPFDMLLKGLGLASTPADPLLTQIGVAGEAIASLIREATGRSLNKGFYQEAFHRGRHWAEGRPRFVVLNERPISVIGRIVTSSGIEVPATAYRVHHALGRIDFTADAAALDGDMIGVEYEGGYDPMPGALTALYLDLVRRQLSAMGVDLSASGGTAVAGAAPIKAVTVGALRVEYAVQAASGAAVQSAGASPLTAAMMEAYRPILDRFSSHRVFAATGI